MQEVIVLFYFFEKSAIIIALITGYLGIKKPAGINRPADVILVNGSFPGIT